jgi:hypothetical protein
MHYQAGGSETDFVGIDWKRTWGWPQPLRVEVDTTRLLASRETGVH